MFNLVSDIIAEYWLSKSKEEKQKEKPTEEFKRFCEKKP